MSTTHESLCTTKTTKTTTTIITTITFPEVMKRNYFVLIPSTNKGALTLC
jgi:hypothetical protein